MSINPGVLCAIAAGVLFGASTPLAKSLVHGIDPRMLAGLLYLGSGIGLGTYRALRSFVRAARADDTGLRARIAGGWLRRSAQAALWPRFS